MKRWQAGITLIEVILSLALMGFIMVMAQKVSSGYLDDTRNQLAASHTKQVIDASQSYIKDKYATVVAGSTATTPLNITIDQLIAGNYLPSGFSTTNSFNQTVSTYALQPAANQIVAVVISTGGTTINDSDLGYIAAGAAKDGTKAGAVRSSASTTLTGALGGWTISLTPYGVTPGAGHLGGVIWFSATGTVMSDFVYRNAVPGHPEANQMNTPLVMASVQTVGQACALGSIARDATGALLTCPSTSLTWSSIANSACTAADFASLPVAGNTLGKICVTTDFQRAYAWNNASWIPISINQNGDITIPGSVIAGGSAGSTYGAITVQGSKNTWSGINFKTSAGANSGTLMMAPSYSGFFNAADNAWRWYVDDAGNSIQPGAATMANAIITGTATNGTACSPNGKVAQDGTGLLLSCQSGVWQKAQGSAVVTSSQLATTFGNQRSQSVSSGNYHVSSGACSLAGNWSWASITGYCQMNAAGTAATWVGNNGSPYTGGTYCGGATTSSIKVFVNAGGCGILSWEMFWQ